MLVPSLTELGSSPAAAPALTGPLARRGARAELRERGWRGEGRREGKGKGKGKGKGRGKGRTPPRGRLPRLPRCRSVPPGPPAPPAASPVSAPAPRGRDALHGAGTRAERGLRFNEEDLHLRSFFHVSGCMDKAAAHHAGQK